MLGGMCFVVFFFNDTATTEIYTLSLHDALPIYRPAVHGAVEVVLGNLRRVHVIDRSEEHTSELQSPCNLVCRLLLEKKKNYDTNTVCASHRPHSKRNPSTISHLSWRPRSITTAT